MSLPSGTADLHIHTLASDGLMSAAAVVDYAEEKTQLDLLAITDHDEIQAAFDAREWATGHGYRVQVVPGVEVTTREGHLLVLFVEDRPPALRPLLETLEWVAGHGGLAIAPHPFTRLTFSLRGSNLLGAVSEGLLAGVEVLNASPAGRASRSTATRFCTAHNLAAVGSSDAHMLGTVGLARTRYPGRSAGDLRTALEEDQTTSAEGRFASAAEIAREAVPQLARSMVHLPLRRVVRALRSSS